jgi:predicted amidohydrolase YtcJ
MHPIRGGLNYNLELRWDGVPSLADALRLLQEQAARTPPPQWVRVVGGWTEFQFAECRMPTLEEINAAAPDTPVFVLHLYDRAWLNGAALRAACSRNIERVKALGGGIAVQDRMAFQGEYFIDRYGEKQARRTPPIRRMLDSGIPVGAGTDATRVLSYNPFVALYWLITGKTVGGTGLYPEGNRLDRMEALRLYTVGSSWFSSEEGRKGSLVPGQLADLSVLSADYFSIREEEIKHLESVLTVVGGRVVFGAGEFGRLGPPPAPVSPDWSPVKTFGGHARGSGAKAYEQTQVRNRVHAPGANRHRWVLGKSGLWALGCDCFAF